MVFPSFGIRACSITPYSAAISEIRLRKRVIEQALSAIRPTSTPPTMPKFQEEKSQRKTNALRKHEEEEVTKLLADRYHIPYVDLAVFPFEIDAIKIFPEEISRSGELAIVRIVGKNLEIALHKPDKPETITILERLHADDYTYDLFLASKSSLEHAWESYKKHLR